MSKTSPDDTCSVFLSRRRIRSPLALQRATTAKSPHYAPYFPLPAPLEILALSATELTFGSTKLFPLLGSYGALQPKPTWLASGRRHLPRPRNPFILFRRDLMHQRKTLPRSDTDHNNISRLAGDVWRDMTAVEKRPWVELAAKERAHHALLYPSYRHVPVHSGAKGKQTQNDETHVGDRLPRQVSRIGAASSVRSRTRRQTERPQSCSRQCIPRRASSCPPIGAVPVSPHSLAEEWTPPLVTRDDMRRRPSQTVMYRSVAPAGHDPLLPLHDIDWHGLPLADLSLSDPADLLLDLDQTTYLCGTSDPGFWDDKRTYPLCVGDHNEPPYDLTALECPTVDTTVIGPSLTQATLSADNNFPCGSSTAIPPFDFPIGCPDPVIPPSSRTSSEERQQCL